jgi:diaminopimelate epimerase
MRMWSELRFIKCHGSGNDFVMIDAVEQDLQGYDLASLTRDVCDREKGIGADGLLLLVRQGDGYAMRMFNPDGSEAEMCGNGIRCVARLAQKYINEQHFTLGSGNRTFAISVDGDLREGVKAFGVEIPITLNGRDFAMIGEGGSWREQIIEELDSELKFTALNLGNPHIVARCEKADLALLESLGEKVKHLPTLFPNGVNVSLYEVLSDEKIFVTTYERGAGITLSCGTAMTASTTAAALAGYIRSNHPIEVCNRGGKVVCEVHPHDDGLSTRLSGNATYEYAGTLSNEENGRIKFEIEEIFATEINSYEEFASEIKRAFCAE